MTAQTYLHGLQYFSHSGPTGMASNLRALPGSLLLSGVVSAESAM